MATPPQRARWARWWQPARVMLSFALLGVAIWFVAGKSSELSGASTYLTHLRWGWLVLGGTAELCSYVALAELQRSLLRAGGVRARLVRALFIAVAGSALQGALPVGAAFASVYEFRQFELLGADEVLAGFTIVGAVVVAFGTIAVLAGIGLGLAASLGTAYDLVGAILGVVCFTLLVLVTWARRSTVYSGLMRATAWAEHVAHRPDGHWARPVEAVLARARAVTPGRGRLSWSASASAASWLADCMCLALSFLAVGTGVPWQGLLLAYCAGQLAANLPITPGGLGVVEGSLTVALVTFGGAKASTVAAVLLYRVLSFWLPLPAGGLAYVALARRHRREEHAPAPNLRFKSTAPASGPAGPVEVQNTEEA